MKSINWLLNVGANFYFFVFIFFWTISQLRRLFWHLSIFQLKEFRFDRYFSWLKSEEAILSLINPWAITKIILLVLLLFPQFLPFCFHAFFLMYFIEGLYGLFQFTTLRFKRPRLTSKVLIILMAFVILFSFLTAAIIILATNNFAYISILNRSLDLGFVSLDILLLPLTLSLLSLLITLNEILRKMVYEKLSIFLKSFNDLKIIAITGSYGKSSTKEFLYEILKDKFKILVIPKNINTEIGIANFILNNLKEYHQILIAEIGAYKMGEIKRIGKTLNPDISILTAISNQHIDLFGSQDNIVKAKFEIAEILKQNGTLIINQDSNLIKDNLLNLENKRPDIKIKRVSIINKSDYYATQICGEKKDGIIDSYSFIFNYGKISIKLKTKLVSRNFILNLCLALATSDIAGIKVNTIENALLNISQPEHSLKIYKNCLNGSLIIDDSYSSNEDGFNEALILANSIKKNQKILIFRSLIELGNISPKIHYELAKKIGKIFNYVILISDNYKDFIILGLKESNFNLKNLYFLKDNKKILKIIKKLADKDTLILLENRLSKILIKNIISIN